MKRMHIHVAVENLGNAEPTVLKSGYCKRKLTDPALNFVISQRCDR
nr:hypothetical protein [Paraburkholderia sp.]